MSPAAERLLADLCDEDRRAPLWARADLLADEADVGEPLRDALRRGEGTIAVRLPGHRFRSLGASLPGYLAPRGEPGAARRSVARVVVREKGQGR